MFHVKHLEGVGEMAKSYRKRKKEQRKKYEKELLKNKKRSKKQVKSKTFKELEKIFKQREYKNNTRKKKRQLLEKQGYSRELSNSAIDKIKISDLENNRFNQKNYPKLFGEDYFDFYKMYSLHGEKLYIAFRDFSCELNFGDIIEMFADMTPKQLLDKLNYIVHLAPEYNKNWGTDSNGKGGDYKIACDVQSNLIIEHSEVRNINRRKRTREHTGNFKGYQVLKDGRNNSFKEVRPIKLLQIANAIMYNVTEWDRVDFYRSFYNIINRHIPEFARILPSPVDWSK